MTPNQLHRSLLEAGHAPGDAITYYTGDAIPAGLYRRTGDAVHLWDGQHLSPAPWIDTPHTRMPAGVAGVVARQRIRSRLNANKK
jgi:hypothetical protein